MANGGTFVQRSVIPRVSHEGLAFDNAKAMYFVDELNGGGVYKFVSNNPDATNGNDYFASGQSFVLRVGAGGQFEGTNAAPIVGASSWRAITDANGGAIAGVSTVNLDGTIDGRATADHASVLSSGYNRPEDLEIQTRDYLDGRPVIARVLKHPYAFNLFSHDSAIETNGYNGEENKVVAELQKILGRPDLKVSATCVRVPVLRAHSASINLELADKVDLETIRAAIANAAGVRLVDDREKNHFPMPNEAQEQDPVLVGRLREDPSHPNAINLFVSGDQLLKGAALNAIQIAEALIEQGRLKLHGG